MAAAEQERTIDCVKVDALVILQIMKHCKQNSPQPVTGQLLGLDVDNVLQVTHSFGSLAKPEGDFLGVPQEDDSAYQLDMQKLLREVNVDANVVGWYQTTHLGQFFSNTVIETQSWYQREIPCSCLLVYDPLQAAIGKPSFKALRLTKQFMERHGEFQGAVASGSDFGASNMFEEIPIIIESPALIEAFLVDWSLMDSNSTTQIESLDTENQVFLERNLQLLIGALGDLAEEQQKLQNYERQAGRQPDKGRGKGRPMPPPRQLDTMILSQQIQNYCKQINDFSGDSFGKLFLLSNKPASVAES